MIVLIVTPASRPLPTLPGLLEQAGHQVRVVSDVRTAVTEIAREVPDVAIVPHLRDPAARTALMDALRSEGDEYRYVLALLDEDTEALRAEAFESGADDVVVPGRSDLEVAAQMRPAGRILKLERHLRERIGELESALHRLTMSAEHRGRTVAATMAPLSTAENSILLTKAWTRVEEVLVRMCSEYLQTEFTSVVGTKLPPPNLGGASIALTDMPHELEVELAFLVPAASAKALAVAFFSGDESMVDADVIRDVVLELANSGMGAVKAAFLPEQYAFAGSVPKSFATLDAQKFLNGAEARRVLALRAGDAVLYLLATLRHKGRVRVLGAALREGMVLAADLKSDAGVLLARAGTRLTETTASKLARMVPWKEIELGDAA